MNAPRNGSRACRLALVAAVLLARSVVAPPDARAYRPSSRPTPRSRTRGTDVGLRHGITRTAAKWGGTAGLTLAFPVWRKGEKEP